MHEMTLFNSMLCDAEAKGIRLIGKASNAICISVESRLVLTQVETVEHGHVMVR
jgi:hypothetical protein